MDDKITLAVNLKKLAQRTSLRKLATAAGIPVSSLGSWSNGQLPSGAAGHKNLRKLCHHLNCSVEQIMFGDISVKPKPSISISDLFEGDKVFEGRFVVDLRVRKLTDDQD